MENSDFARQNFLKRNLNGFTLVELLVVIAVLGILIGVVVVIIDPAARLGEAGDAARLSDMKMIVDALEQYQVIYGSYPEETAPFGAGGWETSDASSDTSQFMEYLVSEGIAKVVPVDPINKRITGFNFFSSIGSYFYAFYHYPATYATYYGCDFDTDFVVIAFREAGGADKTRFPRATCGDVSGGCPRGGIPYVCRDWGTEFDYSIMLR